MATTPKKLVHWALDVSMSEFGSPFSNASSDSVVSTSSLQYINSQLIAHGFTTSPGLTLDGISNKDSDKVVKCLLEMLRQRVEDMSRTEDLQTKWRTLSYDHERLIGMHRNMSETAANAERETNLHKSKLAIANRSLQSSENAHKQTTAELQRTRSILQAVRATHQSELKKKEKEIERITERWSKIADAQTKLLASESGMRCANLRVVEGLEVLGKGQSFTEVALEQAEQARTEVTDENNRLRRLALDAINDAQTVLFQARRLSNADEEEPVPFSATSLFPAGPQDVARNKLEFIISALRESLSKLAKESPSLQPIATNDKEVERLQNTVKQLKTEIEAFRAREAEHHIQTRTLLDNFAQQISVPQNSKEPIVESAAVLEREERLDAVKKQLTNERAKFAEAAVRLGKEKAALQAEQVLFMEERRSWQVERMMAELPVSSDPVPPPSPPKPVASKSLAQLKKPLHKSPRKSPLKGPLAGARKVGGGSGKKVRVHRRSSIGLGSPTKGELPYETEVMPPLPTLTFEKVTGPLLPTPFALPPPSPHSSISSKAPPTLESTTPPLPCQATQPTKSTTPQDNPPEFISSSSQVRTPEPTRRAFPMAKPLNSRMSHAYSPARPSPLSRILMLANSPPSPSGSPPLEAVIEEEYEEGEERPNVPPTAALFANAAEAGGASSVLNRHFLAPAIPAAGTSSSSAPHLLPVRDQVKHRKPSPDLATELGIKPEVVKRRTAPPREGVHRVTAREKGKGRVVEVRPPSRNGTRLTSAGVEKENGSNRVIEVGEEQKVFSVHPWIEEADTVTIVLREPALAVDVVGTEQDSKHPSKATGTKPASSTSRARVMARNPPLATKGMARRVPVDNSTASKTTRKA